jgi:hypothetical protein
VPLDYYSTPALSAKTDNTLKTLHLSAAQVAFVIWLGGQTAAGAAQVPGSLKIMVDTRKSDFT